MSCKIPGCPLLVHEKNLCWRHQPQEVRDAERERRRVRYAEWYEATDEARKAFRAAAKERASKVVT